MAEPRSPIENLVTRPLESKFASAVNTLPRKLSEKDVVPLQIAVATASNQLSLGLQHRLIQTDPLAPITDPLRARKLDPEAILRNDKEHREMNVIAKEVEENPKLWERIDAKVEQLRELMVALYKSDKPGVNVELDDRSLVALLMALEPKNHEAFYFDLDGEGLRQIINDSSVAKTVYDCFPKLFEGSGNGTAEATA